MSERVLTIRQPWADLIMAGQKPVENRTWPVPSTLDPWFTCPYCPVRWRAGEPTPEGRCDGGGAHHGPAQVDGPFPFRLWVHAAKQAEPSEVTASVAASLYRAPRGVVAPIEVLLFTAPSRRGVLLGSVTVTGCHLADECREIRSAYRPGRGERWESFCSRWAEPCVWHWTLANPVALPEPIPLRGRQGLWTLDPGEHDGHDTECEQCAIARLLAA